MINSNPDNSIYIEFMKIFKPLFSTQLYERAMKEVELKTPAKIDEMFKTHKNEIQQIRIKAVNNLQNFIAVLEGEPFDLVVPIIYIIDGYKQSFLKSPFFKSQGPEKDRSFVINKALLGAGSLIGKIPLNPFGDKMS